MHASASNATAGYSDASPPLNRKRLGGRYPRSGTGILRIITFAAGLGLLISAIYGQVVGMRVAELIPESDLRFENDLTLSAEETLEQLQRLPAESDLEFVQRATFTIQAGLAHLDRWYEYDPGLYNQLVPFTENPLLNLLGRYSGMPQIERYHFSDYRRTLERGIGVCGDHAIVLSSVLDENGIDNVLLSSRGGGHIVVEVSNSSDAQGIYDSDFGIVLPGLAKNSMTDQSVFEGL